VPANLTPSIDGAAGDKARPFLDGCDNTFTDAVVHRCTYADTASAHEIVLFGDSHAAQYFPAFDLIANLRHWKLVVLTKATCPPLMLRVHSPVLGRTYRECTEWRRQALARIAREHPAVVILGVARHYDSSYGFTVYGPQWVVGLRETIHTIRASGIPVAVLGPTPKPPFDVPTCLSGHIDDATACATPISQAVIAPGQALERRTTQAAGATYVDVSRWICAPDVCPAIVGNLLVYRDDNHLTTTYATWLTPALATTIPGG